MSRKRRLLANQIQGRSLHEGLHLIVRFQQGRDLPSQFVVVATLGIEKPFPIVELVLQSRLDQAFDPSPAFRGHRQRARSIRCAAMPWPSANDVPRLNSSD